LNGISVRRDEREQVVITIAQTEIPPRLTIRGQLADLYLNPNKFSRNERDKVARRTCAQRSVNRHATAQQVRCHHQFAYCSRVGGTTDGELSFHCGANCRRRLEHQPEKIEADGDLLWPTKLLIIRHGLWRLVAYSDDLKRILIHLLMHLPTDLTAAGHPD
jgi:hypothetical protein